MRRSRFIRASAGLALVVSALVLFFSANEWPSSIDRKLHASIGEEMGREALGLVKPGVGLVAVVRDTEAFRHPESEAQFRAFRRVVERGGSSLVSVLTLQVDPLRALEVPPGDFYELLRKAPAGTAIVSFMGPPKLTAEQRERLGEVRPKVLAFCPGAISRTTDLRGMFERGLLHVAVVEREDAGKKPGFEGQYRVVRASDVGTLPEASAVVGGAP